MGFKVTRPSMTVRCASCNKTARELTGGNNWKMCNVCFITYCSSCWKSVMKESRRCTGHRPTGDFVTGSAGITETTFKE